MSAKMIVLGSQATCKITNSLIKTEKVLIDKDYASETKFLFGKQPASLGGRVFIELVDKNGDTFEELSAQTSAYVGTTITVQEDPSKDGFLVQDTKTPNFANVSPTNFSDGKLRVKYVGNIQDLDFIVTNLGNGARVKSVDIEVNGNGGTAVFEVPFQVVAY